MGLDFRIQRELCCLSSALLLLDIKLRYVRFHHAAIDISLFCRAKIVTVFSSVLFVVISYCKLFPLLMFVPLASVTW